MNTVKLITALVLTVFLSGCLGNNLSGSTYSRAEARQVQHVEYGVVQSVNLVVIEGTNGVVGGATGAVVGGLAGSTIGGGRGKDIAAVVGAVAGGIAGRQAEEALTRSQGQEVTVQLNDGRVISVVQAVDRNGPVFQAGDRVRVLSSSGNVRVTL